MVTDTRPAAPPLLTEYTAPGIALSTPSGVASMTAPLRVVMRTYPGDRASREARLITVGESADTSDMVQNQHSNGPWRADIGVISMVPVPPVHVAVSPR